MTASTLIKIIFFTLVGFSIFVIYYALVVQEEFTIYTNETGPDTSDYFLIEETE
jgi:hypothetical protein